MNFFNEGLAFIAGGIFFWPLVAILFFSFWGLSENNWNVSGVIVLALLVVLTNYQFNYLSFFNTWYTIVGGILAYAIVGGLYSFMRWYLYLRGIQGKFIELRDAFLLKYNLATDFFRTTALAGSSEEKLQQEFITKFKYNGDAGREFNNVPKEVVTMADLLKYITPVASQNKAIIIQRITYWPTSLLWFAISDVVREFAETVYRVIGGNYQKLANSMFNTKEIL